MPENYTDQLIFLNWILLTVLGVLLAAVLAKVFFLLHMISDFMGYARYELLPVIKDIRLTADRVEAISAKAATGAENVAKGLESVKPVVEKGVDRMMETPKLVRDGVDSVVAGIRRSFTSDY